ncbi:lysophosphatidylcholine acyltransferase 2, partial [Plakobranchus ocellatus]
MDAEEANKLLEANPNLGEDFSKRGEAAELIEFSQPVLVKRDDPNSRAHTVQEIRRRATSGGQWPQIIIFPEGTCTNRSCLISFKQGAFLPAVPVQPVCIRYPNRIDTVTWTWEGPGALTQLWLTLCQFYTKVDVLYLPPYHPSEEEKKDPKLYANNVRAAMAECLNCPVTDHTYDDCRLMASAEKMKMPARVGLVEFEKLHSKIGVKYDQMAELLNNFMEIKGAKWREGAEITYDDFSEYLLLPKSEALRQVFDLYDRDGSGTIDFREYVIGLSLVSNPVNNEETIKVAFELFDKDKKGHISLTDLQLILSQAFEMSPEAVERMFREVDTACDGTISY